MNKQNQEILLAHYKAIGPAYLVATSIANKAVQTKSKPSSAVRYEACTD